MFKNNLKIALRQLGRNKVFTAINILGLSLGIAVVLLIAVFVRHEFSYDRWLEGSDRTYRVYRQWVGGGKTVWVPSLLAQKMKQDFPEVEAASGYGPGGEMLLEYEGNQLYVEKTAFVDSNFFKVIPLPFLYGENSGALAAPNGMVITERLARRIFGKRDPVGEAVTLNGKDKYVISGVLEMKEERSHFDGDLFIRFAYYSPSWTGNNRAVYARLHPQAAVSSLEDKLTASIQELIKQELLALDYVAKPDEYALWRLQPLNEVHLHSADYNFFSSSGGSIQRIYIFLLIAFVVIVVAIINYVNLATARATQRAKEVGIKKVAGAGRKQLTVQFIIEAIFQSTLAALLGLILAEWLLPFFNHITNRELQVLGGDPLLIIPGVLALAVGIGWLAGIYPAFVMSAFRPVVALKSGFLKAGEKGTFRKVLVTTQFTVTVILIIVMGFIYRQVQYMMDHDLGFQPDQVMIIPMNDEDTHRKVENLRPKFEEIPGVERISTASRFPGEFMPDWGMLIEGHEEAIFPNVIFSDEHFARTLDITLAEGRFLSREISQDSIDNFVVNEAFVRDYQLEEPLAARIKFTGDSTYGKIVGVMKDFHFQGLGSRIRPMIMNSYHQRRKVGIRISARELPQTVAAIEKLWNEIEPTHPMRYDFLDQAFNEQYAEQQRFGQTLLYATIFTLLIALLGLFGLTSFTVERRTREIGIRKILGASLSGIVALLSSEFFRLVMWAFFIAIPVGYFISSSWLEEFAYRTQLSWWVFGLACVGTLIVGFLTVGIQGLLAAMANPVESLRNE